MKTKVLKIGASWCGPCKQMDNQLFVMQHKLENVEIIHVDTDVSPELAKQYNIRSIPTLIKLDDLGNEVARSTGSLSSDKLLEFLL